MNALLGIVFHFVGGFASGSFYLPFRKVRGWAWESYWIVGGLFSWLLAPFLAALLTVPDFLSIIRASQLSVLTATYGMGVLWGIGGLTFGLAMRYLGMSLGMSLALGYCSVFGALIPPIYRDLFTPATHDTFSTLIETAQGQYVMAGIVVCLIGIFVCGKAGARKEEELPEAEKKATVHEFNLWKGIGVATVSGILSACFNFGIEAGKPLAEAAVARGHNPLFQNNVTFVVLLWGGLTTNLVWCLWLNQRHKTIADYTNDQLPLSRNYLFSALAGTTWFLQFFFYGMGESKLGNGASSWILHMASIILISNAWGLLLQEWKGVSRKTLATIVAGIAIILLSVVLVGYGNALAH